MSGYTKLWYLKNIDIFNSLHDEEFEMLMHQTTMREIKKGDVLYLYGYAAHKLYLLKKGVVKIVKTTSGGKELIIDIIRDGSIFGEVSLIEEQERDEAAVVVEDGMLCEMSPRDFEQMQNQVPGLAIRVTKMIGFRRWKLENKLIDLLYSSVKQRLAKTIFNLIEEFAIPHDHGYLLKIKLTHQDLADLIASTRETVTLTLNKMKNDGVIGTKGRFLVIPDLERLREIAEIGGVLPLGK
jgi:CRP/FNR family cyclic AMP-dependent transcriptional regulator